MASKGFLDIKEVYDGKQAIIEALNNKGMDLSREASLRSIANALNLSVDELPQLKEGLYGKEVIFEEEFPYYPSLQGILDTYGIERDGKVPAYVMLIGVSKLTAIFTSKTNMYGQGFFTSDGVWYNSATVTHTFNQSLDIPTNNVNAEFRHVRWVIVYRDKLDNTAISLSLRYTEQEEILAVLFDKIYLQSWIFSSSTSIYGQRSRMLFIDCTNKTTMPVTGIIQNYAFTGMQKLKFLGYPRTGNYRLLFITNPFGLNRSLKGIIVSKDCPDIPLHQNDFNSLEGFIYVQSAASISMAYVLRGFAKIKGIFFATSLIPSIDSNSFFTDNNAIDSTLIYIEFPEGITTLTINLSYAYKIEEIRLPSTLQTFNCSLSYAYNLRKINIPQSLTFLASGVIGSNKPNIEFIEFPINYNISAINASLAFSGINNFKIEWFYHLAERLIDNTGNATITLNMGAYNISRMPDEVIATLTSKNYSLA